MGRVDENKDGKLDEQEIVAWLEKVEDRNYISEANAVFDKEDTNGDGFVTFEEYWMNTEEEGEGVVRLELHAVGAGVSLH